MQHNTLASRTIAAYLRSFVLHHIYRVRAQTAAPRGAISCSSMNWKARRTRNDILILTSYPKPKCHTPKRLDPPPDHCHARGGGLLVSVCAVSCLMRSSIRHREQYFGEMPSRNQTHNCMVAPTRTNTLCSQYK